MGYVCRLIELSIIMKKAVFVVLGFALFIVLSVQLSSCSKRDVTNPPGVSFITTQGYIYDDTTVYRNSIATIWVQANKLGVDDVLDSGIIQRSINGGPDTTLATMRFISTQFSQFYSYQLGDSGNRYKYIFTFFNQNNVSGSDSVTVTTN
jgi:hypothetical protein